MSILLVMCWRSGSDEESISVYIDQADLVTEIYGLVEGRKLHTFNNNSAIGRGNSFIHSQFEELRPRGFMVRTGFDHTRL